MKKVLYMATVVVLCTPTSVAHYDMARHVYCSYKYTIDAAADHYHVPAKVIIGVIAVESGGNARAANRSSSARGLMQVLQRTQLDIALWYKNVWFADCDPFDSFCSINLGTGYLALLRKRHRLSSWEQVLYAYRYGFGHAGYHKLSDNGRQLRARHDSYVRRVLSFAKQAESVLQSADAAC